MDQLIILPAALMQMMGREGKAQRLKRTECKNQMPILLKNTNLCSQHNDARKSACFAMFRPVRVKFIGVASSTDFGDFQVRRQDASGQKLPAQRSPEIQMNRVIGLWHKKAGSFLWERLCKERHQVFTDLIATRANRRTHCHKDIRRVAIVDGVHCLDHALCNAMDLPFPARMRHADNLSERIVKRNGSAVRDRNKEGTIPQIGHEAVSGRKRIQCVQRSLLGDNFDVIAMGKLCLGHAFCCYREHVVQASAILSHGFLAITSPKGEVQRAKRACTHPTQARRNDTGKVNRGIKQRKGIIHQGFIWLAMFVPKHTLHLSLALFCLDNT
jgi:hypothetical protein